jgi:L-lactate utilization protein LutB
MKEKDMDTLQNWHSEALGKRTVEALEKHGFTAKYLPDGESAAAYILERISKAASVGIGGSKTEKTLGLSEMLSEKGCIVHDHNIPGLSVEDRNAIRYPQLTADFFICGANAITLSGELMNRDAFGNRVAAMMFGPKTVFVIAGVNKIVRNLDEAEKRIRMYAAPMNNKRYETPNPCVQTGECVDCNSKARICNITAILNRRPPLTDIHVLIVGESLGF